MRERDVQRARAVQVGQLARSYREPFSRGGGQRGLIQEALLERMGSVDRDYAERHSHATVSRWESGGTRPALQRLKGGQALEKLTPRERESLKIFAGGKTYAAIAEARGNRTTSVRNAIYRIQEKLAIDPKEELVVWAVEHGLLDDAVAEG